MTPDVRSLSKGQLRKLGALRKSLGNKIADRAFAEWLKQQPTAKNSADGDPVAEKLSAALKDLANDKSLNLGRYGFSIRRAKGKGAKGFVIERIEKEGTPVLKMKATVKRRKKAAGSGRKTKATKKTASN